MMASKEDARELMPLLFKINPVIEFIYNGWDDREIAVMDEVEPRS